MQRGLEHRLLGERLGSHQARAVLGARAERREEDEALRAGALRGLHHAPRRDAVELLDRAARLVADGSRQVHDRVDAAQRVAKGGRIGEVAERDLHAHALGAQPPRVANEAAHVGSFGHQAAKQRGADEAGRAGKEQHRSYNMPLPEPARAGSPVETRKPTERSRWPT